MVEFLIGKNFGIKSALNYQYQIFYQEWEILTRIISILYFDYSTFNERAFDEEFEYVKSFHPRTLRLSKILPKTSKT